MSTKSITQGEQVGVMWSWLLSQGIHIHFGSNEERLPVLQYLDTAVDAAYGRKHFRNDAERVAFLFELYQKYTSLLPAIAPKTRVRKTKAAAPSRGA